MYRPPTAKEERAARKWREAKTAKEAWLAFRTWLLRHRDMEHDGDAPYWVDGIHSHYSAWTGEGAHGLVLFEKMAVMDRFLPDGRGSDRATRLKIATAVCPFPLPHHHKLVRAHARLVGGPVGWVGDLDPRGLHIFGALRSGDLHAPDIAGSKLEVDYLGIDDGWLARLRKERVLPIRYRISMNWVERDYWSIIKRFSPGLRQLIDDEAFALLESGTKIASDSIGEILPSMLRGRLAGWRENSP